MNKSYRFIISIMVTVAVLIPALQIIPIDFMEIQTAYAEGSIVLNGTAATSGTTSLQNQITLSSFNVGTDSNRLLVVGVEASSNPVSSITFGGTQLTKAVSSFTFNPSELWYLTNPSGTGDIVVTMNGQAAVVVGAYSFFGIDQTNPIPTTAKTNGSRSSPTISITTQHPNSWVIDSASIFGGVSLSNPTCTERWNLNVPSTVPQKITGASSSTIQASAGQVTCSWTASSGDFWDSVAVEVKGVAPTPPSAPTNPTSTATSTSQIKLSWTAPSSDGGSAITGYKIQRESTSWVDVVNDTGNTLTNYNVTGLNANSFDVYRIAAWNGIGLGTFSANVTGITLPGAPTSLTATNVSSSQINLSWTTSGNATTGHKIERSLNGGSTWSTIVPNTGSSGTTYSDTGLDSNTAYTYRVSAINAVGTSSPSNTASATTNLPTFGFHSSTGILVPLYTLPTSGSDLSDTWKSVNNTKNNYPRVPVFVIINPDSGFDIDNQADCTDNEINVAAYVTGTANITKSGVVALGYVFTDGGNKNPTDVKTEIDNYKRCLPDVKGIFFDVMPNDKPSSDLNAFGVRLDVYYQDLTDYVHGLGPENVRLPHAFGNPGADTFQGYQGTVDHMTIYENLFNPIQDSLTNSTLQGNTHEENPSNWHTLHDKSTFSFLQFGKGQISQQDVQTRSVYVGLMYYTDDTLIPNPWDSVPPYLDTLASHLNSTSVLSTITAKDKSGNSLSIPIQIKQSNNLVRNGTTPFSYNATSGWQFNFIAPQTPPSHTFCNWTYLGTNTTNNSILVAPIENANYTATYTLNTC